MASLLKRLLASEPPEEVPDYAKLGSTEVLVLKMSFENTLDIVFQLLVAWVATPLGVVEHVFNHLQEFDERLDRMSSVALSLLLDDLIN